MGAEATSEAVLSSMVCNDRKALQHTKNEIAEAEGQAERDREAKENKISRKRWGSDVWSCSQVREGRAGCEEVNETWRQVEGNFLGRRGGKTQENDTSNDMSKLSFGQSYYPDRVTAVEATGVRCTNLWST